MMMMKLFTVSIKLKYILLPIISCLCFLLFYKNINYIKWNTILSFPNTNEKFFINDKYTKIKLNIGIIVVSDAKFQEKYEDHSKNLQCYAKQHGYTFIILDPKSYFICSRLENFFFQKHCAVMNYMTSVSNLHWLLVLDGDNFILNNSKLIEEFIPNNDNIHVIHYERFYTGEIMAGAYLIKNHPWSYNYLLTWVNFYSKLPKKGYHNHDNGALHMIILQMIDKNNEIQMKCYSKYLQSLDEWKYYQYIRCFRCSIGGQRIFKHIQILRRAHGFSRDFSILFQNDFLLHGYKNNLNEFFYNTNKCTNDHWLLNIRQNKLISNLTIAKEMTRKKDQYALEKYSLSLGITDITDCWPHCEQEITGEKLNKYLRALCDK